MTITFLNNTAFELKSKEGTVYTDPIKINETDIENPGEYEIAGISCDFSENIAIYKLEGIKIAHFDKRKKPLTETELEKLSNVDILFMPIGGAEVFSAKEALEITGQIEPKILIPMHYEQKDLTEFCKEEGICAQPLEVFKINKNNLTEEKMQVVLFKAKN